MRRRDQVRQSVERRELRYPGVAQLTQVRQRITGKRGEQFLVRGGPGQLLNFYAYAGIPALEVGE
jgi:hypothetical protein